MQALTCAAVVTGVAPSRQTLFRAITCTRVVPCITIGGLTESSAVGPIIVGVTNHLELQSDGALPVLAGIGGRSREGVCNS